jgi:hypothetical protein
LSHGKGKILVEEHPSPIVTAHLPTHALLIVASLSSIHHPSPNHLNYSSMNYTSAASSTPSISMPKKKAGSWKKENDVDALKCWNLESEL